MTLFDAFALFFPYNIEVHVSVLMILLRVCRYRILTPSAAKTRDLRLAVDGVQHGTPYDNPRETIGYVSSGKDETSL